MFRGPPGAQVHRHSGTHLDTQVPVRARRSKPHIREANARYGWHQVVVLSAPYCRRGDAGLLQNGPHPVARVGVVVPRRPCVGTRVVAHDDKPQWLRSKLLDDSCAC
jgi:hypothetical protein